MATWIAHMRIAEHFMKNEERLNNNEFLVGNIGPDCGVPNEDWSEFTPDTQFTHWKLDGKNIDAEDFRVKYINAGNEVNPFFIGYYFHLLTDIAWEMFYSKKALEPIYYVGLNADAQFIWTIKNDWYGQDHLYLERNPESIFFRNFQHIHEFDNVYINIFPKDAFTKRVKYITDFYLSTKEVVDRDFPFLSKDEMDSFVIDTIAYLEGIYEKM